MSERYIVKEEVWQNERWQPAVGYTIPFSLTAHYTDKSGDIPLSKNSFPEIKLPQGWDWVEQSWELDKSGVFGGCDNDGWMYGTTFETLNSKILSFSATGVMSPPCMVRKRRWVRRRQTITLDAFDLFRNKVDNLKSSKTRLDNLLRNYQSDLKFIEDHESQRLVAFKKIYTFSDNSINKYIFVLDSYIDKLSQFESFLHERGLIEKDYSRKLDHLTSKWLHNSHQTNIPTSVPSTKPDMEGIITSAGETGSSPSTSTISFTSSPAPSPSRISKEQGFFHLINVAIDKISKRFQSLGVLLVDNLTSDIVVMLTRVKEAVRDIKAESFNLRRLLRDQEDQVTQLRKQLQSSLDAVSVLFCDKMSFITNQLITFDLHQEEPLTLQSYKENYKNSILTGNTDIWIHIQKYYRGIFLAESMLHQYYHFSEVKYYKIQKLMTQVLTLLQSTMKIYVNEQVDGWDDASVLLLTHLGSDVNRIRAMESKTQSRLVEHNHSTPITLTNIHRTIEKSKVDNDVNNIGSDLEKEVSVAAGNKIVFNMLEIPSKPSQDTPVTAASTTSNTSNANTISTNNLPPPVSPSSSSDPKDSRNELEGKSAPTTQLMSISEYLGESPAEITKDLWKHLPRIPRIGQSVVRGTLRIGLEEEVNQWAAHLAELDGVSAGIGVGVHVKKGAEEVVDADGYILAEGGEPWNEYHVVYSMDGILHLYPLHTPPTTTTTTPVTKSVEDIKPVTEGTKGKSDKLSETGQKSVGIDPNNRNWIGDQPWRSVYLGGSDVAIMVSPIPILYTAFTVRNTTLVNYQRNNVILSSLGSRFSTTSKRPISNNYVMIAANEAEAVQWMELFVNPLCAPITEEMMANSQSTTSSVSVSNLPQDLMTIEDSSSGFTIDSSHEYEVWEFSANSLGQSTSASHRGGGKSGVLGGGDVDEKEEDVTISSSIIQASITSTLPETSVSTSTSTTASKVAEDPVEALLQSLEADIFGNSVGGSGGTGTVNEEMLRQYEMDESDITFENAIFGKKS